MYLDYFGLERDPFTISPDPAFLYPSPQHRQALAHLKYGLDREGGFILLTGEVGTGKTTLTRLLLEQLPGNIRVAYILNAKLNSRDVLASICSELSLKYSSDDSIKALTDLINRDLLEAYAQGKKTLVVIEEAQNLDPDVLEMLRLLTNLETNTAKLMHILLVGQPELLDLIARNELRQLNQRVVSRFHLEPLEDRQETTHYLSHRLRRAGCNRTLFDTGSIRTIHRLSGGVPRVVNLLAERALLGAYATNKKQVSAPMVQAASKEVFGKSPVVSMPRRKPPYIAIAAMFAFVVIGIYLFMDQSSTRESASVMQESSFAIEPGNTVEAGDIPEAIEESVPIEPVIEEPAVAASEELSVSSEIEMPSGLNAYEQLLEIWGLKAIASDQATLCTVASQNGLSCQQDSDLQMAELFEINRPGLLRLTPSEDSQYLYLLYELRNAELLISNSQDSRSISPEVFEGQWDTEFLYLWPAPDGYQGLVAPGTRNPELVSWVQQQLVDILDGYEYIYNGGVYSSLIADRVAEFQASQGLKPDGLLGPRTLLRLMEQTENLPVLALRDNQAGSLAQE
jgi:general secretion pathway protein A